jgi:hypothetical protein
MFYNISSFTSVGGKLLCWTVVLLLYFEMEACTEHILVRLKQRAVIAVFTAKGV